MDRSAPFVTHEQCETHREKIVEGINDSKVETAKIYGEIKAQNVHIQNLINTSRWFMGVASTVLGGLLIWLITG